MKRKFKPGDLVRATSARYGIKIIGRVERYHTFDRDKIWVMPLVTSKATPDGDYYYSGSGYSCYIHKVSLIPRSKFLIKRPTP